VLTSTPVHPCIVLLDMMMPRMNGNEVMEALAKTPLAQMPIVVISAYPGDVHQTARRVLRKPMNPDTVLDVVEEFCPPYAS
jgi:CheY-like chemotaxis protein